MEIDLIGSNMENSGVEYNPRKLEELLLGQEMLFKVQSRDNKEYYRRYQYTINKICNIQEIVEKHVPLNIGSKVLNSDVKLCDLLFSDDIVDVSGKGFVTPDLSVVTKQNGVEWVAEGSVNMCLEDEFDSCDDFCFGKIKKKMKKVNLIEEEDETFVSYIIYTIEFQKRGLPHAHILFFLSNEDKQPHPRRIDEIISAEIPGPLIDPYYYECVKELMMHGLCGVVRKSSPCMRYGRCTKYYPKKFVSDTVFDDDGYPIYRRRDNGRVVLKDGISLDNRYVVPHHRFLLVKYVGHINVEWCNKSRSIKYLFKYVHKSYDRVTTSFFQSGVDGAEKNLDEVSLYYDYRYVSACETAWRTFGFGIQYKDPSIERTIHESKFLGWMEVKKLYSEGRNLTYGEFPTKFVWKKDHWDPRKQRYSVGRLFYVALGSGDMYYLRCLLNVVKGAICYEDLRFINGVQYDSFIDACFALGLLDDDKEYIDGIVEASFWSSAHSLRLLFVSLLSSESVSRADVLWQKCWKHLSDDAVYNQRKLRNRPGREHLEFLSKFTDEQLNVHDTIMSPVNSKWRKNVFCLWVWGYRKNIHLEVFVSRDSFERMNCVKCGIQWHSFFIVTWGWNCSLTL
ncbi:uncharacterized protein LOC121808911 [Salvia splendens]|uniref:uncharacterized protein LOC121808911 n=1 Tax=Salvia splendens TaxID=180675 RepID=UPI001C27B500|nr:uncharacterized protein LOC121808911 [Salvia splendens]